MYKSQRTNFDYVKLKDGLYGEMQGENKKIEVYISNNTQYEYVKLYGTYSFFYRFPRLYNLNYKILANYCRYNRAKS